MQKSITGLMVAGMLLCAAAPLSARGLRGGRGGCGDGCGAPCGNSCGYEVTWVKKTVTCYEMQYEDKDETRQVCRMVPDVVEETHKCMVRVPDWHDETRTVTCYENQGHEEDRDVVCCRRVPVCCVDPCTGCSYMSCQVVQETRKVKVWVNECVAVKKDITVRVCGWKEEERSWTTKCYTCKMVTENVPVKVRYCKWVAVDKEVLVPECHPVACAPCVTACYSGCGDCGGCGGCDDGCGHHRRFGRR